jgi:malate dehydrogenase (oxaloacetate-decarboxylating)
MEMFAIKFVLIFRLGEDPMKSFSYKIDSLTGEEYYEVYLQGERLLSNSLLNKGSAFLPEERSELGLSGLLSEGISTIEEQIERAYDSFKKKPDDMEKYIFLLGLLNRNETLYYRILIDNIEEMLPIVYTPTVGKACQQLSRIMRRPRGIYISPLNIGKIDDILRNVQYPDTRLIVVTDGERILGLGDLGVDGMGISIGKVSLYVAASGLNPSLCIPMCLDVGTNNESLLKDPLYLGLRQPRLEGDEYYSFIERFVIGLKRNLPGVLLQWEDFSKKKAFTLLKKYRDRILSFDDDIQGTGATALSSLITAMKIKNQKFSDQKFVIVGMGQAGSGIADSIRSVLMEEGLSPKQASLLIYAIDKDGLIMEGQQLEEQQKPYAKPRELVSNWNVKDKNFISLEDVVNNAKPTVLIGVTAMSGLFNEKILKQMGENCERPVIMPLSNPTSKTECTPSDALKATGGRALIATGSPFKQEDFEGKSYKFSQCNNLYIFPGVGLGALVSQSTKVTDRMFIAASKALSNMVSESELKEGLLLPSMKNIRKVSFEVALAVCKEARESQIGRDLSDSHLVALISKAQWEPHYYPYRAGKNF